MPTDGFGKTLDEMDVEAFFNMRKWLQDAVEAKGARFVGGSVGTGVADIDVELEGSRFNITIRPLRALRPAEPMEE